MILFVGFSDDRRSFFPVLILFVFFVLVIIVVRVARRQHVAHDSDEADVDQPGENVFGDARDHVGSRWCRDTHTHIKVPRCRCSRSASSNDMRGSGSSWRGWPLTV